MNRFSRMLCWCLLALMLLLLTSQAAWACPTCKDGLAQNDPQAASLVRGYFMSILFMMSMPFLIVGGLVGYFYWEVRKSRQNQLRPETATGAAISCE